MVLVNRQVGSKDFRRSIKEKFLLVWLLEVNNLILIGFILLTIAFLTTENCL